LNFYKKESAELKEKLKLMERQVTFHGLIGEAASFCKLMLLVIMIPITAAFVLASYLDKK
jgi:hypothetical protein